MKLQDTPQIREDRNALWRRVSSRLVIVFATAATIVAGYLYFTTVPAADACSSVSVTGCSNTRGLRVAVKPAGPWYDEGVPALSDEIPTVCRNLYPGVSGQMVAYVKNVGDRPGVTSVVIGEVADSGGAYTEPERTIEPRRDVGDLSANIAFTLTYASSLRPNDRRVVAQGNMRDLAVRGRVVEAPVMLQPFSARGAEVGIWRIDLAVPMSADNRIQGDRASCSLAFGLTQTR